MNEKVASIFNLNVDRYLATGVRKSLLRNKHMNKYDGEDILSKEVGVWLHKYADSFAASYQGGTSCGSLIDAAVESAKQFLKTETLPYKQTTTEAIIVDFLNYIAGMSCGMDLALYTSDMSK